MSLCEGLLRRLANSNDDEARDLREMIDNAVALRKENSEFEAEFGMLHEAILEMIATGDHDDVVNSIITMSESQLSRLPADFPLGATSS